MNSRGIKRSRASHAGTAQWAATLGRHKALTAIGAFIIISVIVYAVDPKASDNPTSPPTAAPTSTMATAHMASKPTAAASRPANTVRQAFPPTTLAGFRSLATTGNASEVHVIRTTSEGLPSCPTPTIDVTVSSALVGRALQADLAAFFQQLGLTSSRCQAFVFAFHNRSDFQAHNNDGYTAGRVALTNTSGSQRNLEVDTGSVYATRTRFSFNF
jgi:hypothetical protein